MSIRENHPVAEHLRVMGRVREDFQRPSKTNPGTCRLWKIDFKARMPYLGKYSSSVGRNNSSGPRCTNNGWQCLYGTDLRSVRHRNHGPWLLRIKRIVFFSLSSMVNCIFVASSKYWIFFCENGLNRRKASSWFLNITISVWKRVCLFFINGWVSLIIFLRQSPGSVSF